LTDYLNVVVTKLRFLGLFNEAWTQISKPDIVIAGFKMTDTSLDSDSIKVIQEASQQASPLSISSQNK